MHFFWRDSPAELLGELLATNGSWSDIGKHDHKQENVTTFQREKS